MASLHSDLVHWYETEFDNLLYKEKQMLKSGFDQERLEQHIYKLNKQILSGKRWMIVYGGLIVLFLAVVFYVLYWENQTEILEDLFLQLFYLPITGAGFVINYFHVQRKLTALRLLQIILKHANPTEKS